MACRWGNCFQRIGKDGEGESYRILRAFINETGSHQSFVEWERAPERKRIAHELLKTKNFTAIPGK